MKKRFILFFICFSSLQIQHAQVVFNEVYIRPDGSNNTPPNGLINIGSKEYIELYNKGCSDVDLAGYFIACKNAFLSASISGITIRIPNVPEAKIKPGGHVVLGSKDPGAGVVNNVDIPISGAEIFCGYTGNKVLSNGDGWLALYDPTGKPLECVYWSGSAGNITSGNNTVDFDPGTICLPNGSPNVTLQTARQIFQDPNTKNLVTYIANSNPILIYREKDGSSNWKIYGTPFNISTIPWTIDKTAPTGRCNGKDCIQQVASFKLNSTVKQPTCGGKDGEISFDPTPVGSYTYNWPFTVTGNPSTASGLEAKSYKITITGNGCSKDTTIILSAPNAPTLSATKTNPTTCSGTGTIELTTNAPDGSYTITHGSGQPFTNVNVIGGKASIPNVTTGFYYDLQIEVGGCKSPLGNGVKLEGPSAPTLVATAKQPVTCTDKGAIDFKFTGVNDGNNYEITYGTGLKFQNVLVSSNSATIQDLTANTYSDLQITVNGCTSALGVSVTINPPPASPSATATPKDATKCLEKGSIELALKNVPNASYDISYNGGQTFTGIQVLSDVAIISNVDLGAYNNLTFTANGCPVIVQPTNLTISGPTPITGIEEKMLSPFCGASDGKITVMNVIGGSNPNFEYALNTGAFQTSPAFENLAAGNYTINVRDDKSCEFQKPVVLAPGEGNPTVFIPNVFTPNDDENDVNEVWNVSASCVKELNCQIFNRWGNLVHEITDPKGSWDGKDSAAGVYFYKLVVSSEGDKQENYHGYITLIR